MSYVDFITPAVEHAKLAATFDESKEYEKAHKEYLQAIEGFMIAVKHEKTPQKKVMLRKKATELMERAEKIKEYIDNRDENNPTSPGKGAGVGQKNKEGQN